MLSSELTPLLEGSIELWEANARLDVDGAHKTAVLFEGTKVLQSRACVYARWWLSCGRSSHRLRHSARPVRSHRVPTTSSLFLFIGFLPIFVIAASWYVWAKGVERGLKKSKLLLDCVMIIMSDIPPEPPMELSLAVNASLVALRNYAIFCTEPFRIPFAGRVL